MKRLFSVILVLCTLFSSIILFRTSSRALDSSEQTAHKGVVSLDGKKIMVVGNSMVYYGNCVIYGDQGEEDKGYLYQLIKQNGEEATVIDHTYSGQKLDNIFKNYISKLSEEELDVDYLVLSEGNQDNYDLLGTVEKYLEIFPEDVEFRFLRQPMMFEKEEKFYKPWLIEGVEKLREAGYFVVDWGKLVYDIYSGQKQVPGATMEFKRTSFMKENLGFDNIEGTVHGATSGKDGDRNHENPLAGYITAQMLYSSLTNRSAYLNNYEFCYDTSIHENFNIDNFAKSHYTDPEHPTNFHKIFRSPEDMLGLQILMDEYLIAEGLHPLTVQPEVKPTCVGGGLTLGSYCKLCNESVDIQQFVPGGDFSEHTLVTEKGTAPTCTKPGKTVGISCSACGEKIIKQENIAPTGHYIHSKVYKASTATEGKIKKICLYCDETFETDPIRKVTTLKLSQSLYTYNGKVKTPRVIVADADGKSLEENEDYTVTYPEGRIEIGNYKVSVQFKGNYKSTKELTFKIRPDVVTNFKGETVSSTSVKLSWNAVTNTTHYRVYKYNSATGNYDYVATTGNTNIKLSGLTTATKFKYRIRAFTRVGDNDYFSEKYAYVTTMTKPAKSGIKSLSSKTKKYATITLKSINLADGYEITYSTSKSFKNAKSVTVSKSKLKTTIKKLTSGKKYYFKARAYRKFSGKKVYGKYSSIKSKKIK